MKKTTIIILIVLLIVVIGFALNPFYWFMQPKEKPNQPELSKQETEFFNNFKNKCKCDVERFYYNFDSKGNETLDFKNYNKTPFKYSLAINQKNIHIDSDSIQKIVQHVKDNILLKNKNLKNITVHINYESYEYLYDNKKDSLMLQKEK
ncbi:hypothetical protein ACL0VS_11995 [Chryseobacterium sp. PMSZPI]|uniref:hypothetical protein n=1 Tax=Chryseobacterium sp. PMSZPI TaxID=1033900 RepID=UPI0039A0B292